MIIEGDNRGLNDVLVEGLVVDSIIIFKVLVT